MNTKVRLASAWLPLCLLAAACQQSPTSPSANPDTASSAFAASASNGAPASAVGHSVTGSGSVSIDGITFTSSVAAHSNANGRAWGEVTGPADLTAFGLGKLTFGGHVTCLDVDGNSAWIGAVVDHTTNGEVLPEGLVTITLVRDLGGNSRDIMHTEVFDPGTSCTERPDILAETIVTHGNFKVQ
jgi:hypothetical protein